MSETKPKRNEMKKTLLVILSVLIVAALIYLIVRITYNPTNESTEDDALVPVECGSGKKVFQYKHPSKMFPLIIREYSTNVKLTTGIMDNLVDSQGSSSFNVEAKNKVLKLREELNQDNSFYENQLKAIFFEVNRDPCNDSLSKVYTNYVQEMSFKVLQMKQFVTNITKRSEDTKGVSGSTKKPIVVINPSKGEVKKTSDSIKPDELVIVKEDKKINDAIKTLDEKTTPTTPVTQISKYKLVVEDDRYTGQNYLSQIETDEGETIVTVFVNEVTESLNEATMYLSIPGERTPSFSIKANEPSVKFLDNNNLKITIKVDHFGKSGKVRVAYYKIRVEKRI